MRYGVNSGGSPGMSRAYGFLLESTPMKIGAGMTFLEVAFRVNENWQLEFVCDLKFGICHWEPHGPLIDWLRKDG